MFFNANQLRVLAIGAHPDDIELGCGGFLWRLKCEFSARIKFLVVSPGLRTWQHGREFSRQVRARECGPICPKYCNRWPEGPFLVTC